MPYQNELNEYERVEQQAHISNPVSILNKATQEYFELKQAKHENNLEEMVKETRDLIVNVLSATAKTGVLPDEKRMIKIVSVSDEQFDKAYAGWNEAIQGYNQEYSREIVTPEQLKFKTEWLVSNALTYGNVNESIAEILKFNAEKFRGRLDKYRPQIDLKKFIATYPDFPKPGILFRDISPLLRDKKVMEYITNELIIKTADSDVIAGLDARGFLFGMPVAMRTGKPFVMVRKKGKLPGETINQSYQKEYGEDIIEVQEGAILPGQKVALIDDLLATGGTMNAAGQLIEKTGGEVEGMYNIIQLNDSYCASEREKIGLQRYKIASMVEYDV